MRKTKLALSLIAGIFIYGCNNSAEKEANQQADSMMVAPPANTQIQQLPDSTASVQVPAQSNAVPQNATPASNPNAGLTGMNPAHGQPGHRCDIAVGAPLNSPPGNNAQVSAPGTIQASPTISPTVQGVNTGQKNSVSTQPGNAQPVVTAPGMNPPHGQPGHDCSIAVGAPLKK